VPLTATNFITKGPVLHADLLQFYNLFTGVMTDQPITFKNTLGVGGNQGATTVPLKLYGAVGQTTHLMDLYADTTQTQPGWGIAALGGMGWGPSGGAAQDTFLSRVATQNGHASDTSGLLISPYLEVAGGIGFNGALSFLTSGASLSQGGAGSLELIINQDLKVNRGIYVGSAAMGTSGQAAGIQIGGAPSYTTYGLTVLPTVTSASAAGVLISANVAATVTSSFEHLQISGATAAATFNLTSYAGIHVYNLGKGAGSTVQTAYGILVDSITAASGTSSGNFGIYIAAPSGASVNNYGLYNVGTTYLAANVSAPALLISGGIQVTGQSVASTGVGLELGWNGSVCYVQGYNRAGSYVPLTLLGSQCLLGYAAGGWVSISTSAGSVANSPVAQLAFSQTTGPKICLYDAGGGNYFGFAVNSGEFAVANPGTFIIRQNSGGGGMLWQCDINGIVTNASDVHVGRNLFIGGNTVYWAGSFQAWVDNGASILFFVRSTGYYFYGPTSASFSGLYASAFNVSSAVSGKSGILAFEDPLRVVLNPTLHGVSYTDITKEPGEARVGFIADAWNRVVPEIVALDADGEPLAMDYAAVGAITFEALKTYILATDARLNALEAKLAA